MGHGERDVIFAAVKSLPIRWLAMIRAYIQTQTDVKYADEMGSGDMVHIPFS
jgi:hypothetical protein